MWYNLFGSSTSLIFKSLSNNMVDLVGWLDMITLSLLRVIKWTDNNDICNVSNKYQIIGYK